MSLLNRRRFTLPPSRGALHSRRRAAARRACCSSATCTGETLEAGVFRRRPLPPDALGAVNHLLRDFHPAATSAPWTWPCSDLLHALRAQTGSRKPYQIISGYRSPATNRMLHERSSVATQESAHGAAGPSTSVSPTCRWRSCAMRRWHCSAAASASTGLGLRPRRHRARPRLVSLPSAAPRRESPFERRIVRTGRRKYSSPSSGDTSAVRWYSSTGTGALSSPAACACRSSRASIASRVRPAGPSAATTPAPADRRRPHAAVAEVAPAAREQLARQRADAGRRRRR